MAVKRSGSQPGWRWGARGLIIACLCWLAVRGWLDAFAAGMVLVVAGLGYWISLRWRRTDSEAMPSSDRTEERKGLRGGRDRRSWVGIGLVGAGVLLLFSKSPGEKAAILLWATGALYLFQALFFMPTPMGVEERILLAKYADAKRVQEVLAEREYEGIRIFGENLLLGGVLIGLGFLVRFIG